MIKVHTDFYGVPSSTDISRTPMSIVVMVCPHCGYVDRQAHIYTTTAVMEACPRCGYKVPT